MPTRLASALRAAPLAGLMLLAACSGRSDVAELDNELLANGADPALTSALEDQILVDPNLVQQANPNSARRPETPVQSQYPAGSAQNAAARMGADLQYGPEWAQRLPAEFAMYPGARLTEAAGSNADERRLRVVTFRTADPHERVIAYYHAAVTRAGYNAEQQRRGADHVLGGINEQSDGAYYLIVTPTNAGSEVALIVNNGR